MLFSSRRLSCEGMCTIYLPHGVKIATLIHKVFFSAAFCCVCFLARESGEDGLRKLFHRDSTRLSLSSQPPLSGGEPAALVHLATTWGALCAIHSTQGVSPLGCAGAAAPSHRGGRSYASQPPCLTTKAAKKELSNITSTSQTDSRSGPPSNPPECHTKKFAFAASSPPTARHRTSRAC